MGEETDNVVESTSKLQEKIKALSGIDILTDAGDYKDTYTILKEIGQVWEDMSDIDQAALLELMAGKNRANTLSAILSNMKDLEGAYESAMNAEGSALKENETHLDSIQGRIDLFNNSVQTMWMNFIDSDVVKFIVDVGSGLIKLVDNVGLLETAIAGVLTYLSISKKSSFDLASLLGIHDLKEESNLGISGLTDAIKKLFGKKTKETNMADAILGDKKDIHASTQEFLEKIDAEISSVELKLKSAKGRLKFATKSDDNNPIFVDSSDEDIDQITKEIEGLENQLMSLREERDKFTSDEHGSIAESIIGQESAQDYTSMLSALTEIQGKMLEIGDEQHAAKVITEMSDAAKVGQVDLANYVSTLDDVDIALKAYAASVEDGNYSLAGFQKFISSHNAGLKASSVGAKAAAVGHQLLNAALSMGISLIASFAIQEFVKLLDKLIQTNKEAAESAEDAINKYKELQSTLKSNKSTIEEISDDYAKLSNGVDNLGNNVSLSASQYERYNEIVNKIADMFPEMVQGYTDEGNAIIKNKGNVEALTEAYKMLKQESNNALLLKAKDIMQTYKYTVEGGFWQFDDSIPDSIKAAKKLEEIFETKDSYNFDIFGQEYREEVYDDIVGLLTKSGIKKESTEKNSDYVKRAINEFPGIVQSIINTWESTVNSAVSNTKPLVTAYLEQSIGYAGLGSEQKSVINSIVSSFDEEFFSQFNGDASKMYQTLENIIQNIKTSGIGEEYNLVLDAKTSFNGDEISTGEYKKQIDDFVSKLNELKTQGFLNDNDVKYIKLSLDIDDNGTDVDKFINHTESLFGNLTDEIKLKISALKYSDLQIINSDLFNVDQGTLLSWDELIAKIEEAKIAATQDFDITNFTEAISNHSAIISEYQEAIQKLDKGSFTMDDFMDLIKKYPELAKGVDISSNAFYGLSRNLNKAIKTSTKSFIKDLKELKVSLEAAGKSTDSIDQLIEAVENMPDDALDDIVQKYSTLADKIREATTAQDKLMSSMEENPNQGYETRGEAMEYMKEAMEKGEIGSESNLWNVAEKYGFTYDSAKTINENADALAKFIAIREKWFAQDDDGDDRTDDGYSYKGTESFIKDVESAVQNNAELQKYLVWDYDENTGALNFDYNNKDWDTIVSILSKTKELAGLTSDEFADLMIQVGQYFGIEWGNYDDAVDHLNEIADGSADAKTKVEEYGKYMQDYFGQNTEIDLTARPMVDSKTMQEAGWEGFKDGDYATLYSGSYSSDDNSVAISVTPILPDGKVLDPKSLEKYATEIANGTDPAEVEIVYKDKETGEEKKYTGKDILLNRFTGTNKEEQASQYGTKLSEAQAGYDQLRDTLGINTILAEKGIDGLKEISELQGVVETNSKGITVINEEAFTSALEEANYTEDQIDLIIEKIKTLSKEAFNVDFLKIDDTLDKNGVSALKEISELQGAIKEDADTGITILDTDMFASALEEAGYTEAQIDSLIKKIQEYNNVVSISSDTDPLGLSNVSLNVDSLKASLNVLGIAYDEVIGKWGDNKKDLKINVQDLVTTLKEKGWTDEAIKSYCAQLSETNLEGFNIKVNQEEIDAAIAKANEVPEEESTEYTITGTGLPDLKSINDELSKIPSAVSTQYTITETTIKETKTSDSNAPSSAAVSDYARPTHASRVNGTVNVKGTAFNGGSFSAPKSETALVGELGPEMLVRNGRWTTIGENGAEFTQVKKGDIIFNHRQTEELLKNGYVTGRGRAYASGTAYSTGGGTFARYEFSGSGGYIEYDVNDTIVERWGDLSGAVNEAADSANDFEETIDWIEIRLEEINEQIGLMNAELENASNYASKNNIIDNIIGANENKMGNLMAGIKKYSEYAARLLNEVPAQYRKAVQDGSIAITEFAGEANEKTVEAINNYREWAQKVADLKQQLEEVKTEIRELAIQKIDNAQNTGDVKATVEDSQTEKLQNAVDLIEESGNIADDDYYLAMMENSNKKVEYLTAARKEMQKEFDDAVKSGAIIKGSDEWYENLDKLYQIDSEIAGATKELEEFQNSINDIYWDNFDQLISRLDYVNDDAQGLIDLMDSADMVTHSEDREYMPGGEKYWTSEDVTWTDEGLATMGLYAQQMEVAEAKAKQYAKAIDDLKADFEAGKYSENEYLEKLNELTSSQYDAIESYHDAQDAIKDLNKTRIDMIKDGIEKEIDAYAELADKRKESLDAEKEAYNWEKSISKQQKSLSDIDRQLAAIAGDNSMAAAAKRKRLEAERAELQSELDDMYYERSVDNQKKAIDTEVETFTKNKEEEIKKWDEYLENVELLIADSLGIVQTNASGIYDTLSSKASEYDLTLHDALLTPWQDGSSAVSDYQTTFDTASSSTMEQLELINQKWQEIIETTNGAAKASVDAINAENNAYIAAEKQEVKNEVPKQQSTSKSSSGSKSVTVGSTINASGATIYATASGGGANTQYYGSDPIYVVIGENGGYWMVRHRSLSSGVTGWFKKSDVSAYAKGTTGTKKDELAWIDELGPELQLVPDGNGRLEYIKHGTAIIPHDISENLIKLGQLDPSIMLDQNRPTINAPHVVNNETVINLEYGDILHIDNFSGDKPEDLSKMIDKAFNKHMKQLNSEIRRFTR